MTGLPPFDDCEWCGSELTILGVNSEGWIASVPTATKSYSETKSWPMVDQYTFSDDVAHHVLKVLRPLHTAKRELDFLTRYVTMADEGVARWHVTGEQLDRIDAVLGQLRKAFYDLDQANQ